MHVHVRVCLCMYVRACVWVRAYVHACMCAGGGGACAHACARAPVSMGEWCLFNLSDRTAGHSKPFLFHYFSRAGWEEQGEGCCEVRGKGPYHGVS